MRLPIIMSGLALLGGGLVLGGHGSATAASQASVKIKDIDFKPSRLEVDRGTRVTWTFLDSNVIHEVRSKGDPEFDSSRFKKQGTHSVRFTRRGTYAYRCTIHPNMKGRVVVK